MGVAPFGNWITSPLGVKQKDLVGIHLDFTLLEELVRDPRPSRNALQPSSHFAGRDGKGVLHPHAVAVGPMRSHARTR